MKKMIQLVVSLSFLVWSQTTPFIYEATILRKWDAARDRFHYFIGCSDFHDKGHAVNDEQLKNIEQVLARCDKKATKVILEDLSSRGSDGRFACGNFCVNSRGGVLGGLAKRCESMGFGDVENVEYRYCRVTALGPVLNNLNLDMHQFPSVANTPVSALLDEYNQVVKEVKGYKDAQLLSKKDGQKLTKYYADALNEIHKELHIFDMQRHANDSIAVFLNKRVAEAEKLNFLKHLLTFDSALLDLKVIHAVVNAAERQKVITFAGGAHIERVSSALQKVGYEPVYVTKKEMVKEYDLSKCYVGSTVVNGAYCVKPKPLDGKFFDQYL